MSQKLIDTETSSIITDERANDLILADTRNDVLMRKDETIYYQFPGQEHWPVKDRYYDIWIDNVYQNSRRLTEDEREYFGIDYKE